MYYYYTTTTAGRESHSLLPSIKFSSCSSNILHYFIIAHIGTNTYSLAPRFNEKKRKKRKSLINCIFQNMLRFRRDIYMCCVYTYTVHSIRYNLHLRNWKIEIVNGESMRSQTVNLKTNKIQNIYHQNSIEQTDW